MAGHLLGGRYTLLTPIAQGGMGEVWKARDRETGRMVAAKVLRPELSGEELSLSRLRIEARNAMRIQHPNIASVLDSGEEDGRGWIVMELVEGRPLTDYLRGGARVPVEDLVPVVIQVALALDAAAAAGVVHRDIKPANILIRPDGVVKLTDFGISRTSDQANLTAAGMVMGTAQYLPPEQAMGETATSSGDLYALGVIAYEAAAGRRPFTGATQVDIAFSHVNDPVPALPEDVPLPFAKVVLHLLEKDPHRRPTTGAALVRELVAAAHTLDMPVDPHPLPVPSGGDSPSPDTAGAPEALRVPVAPVLHERRRVLPEEMLRPPTADEGASRPPTADEGVSRERARTPQSPASPQSPDSATSTADPGQDGTPPPRHWRALRPAAGAPAPTPDAADAPAPAAWSPDRDVDRPHHRQALAPGTRTGAGAAPTASAAPGRSRQTATPSGSGQETTSGHPTPGRRARHAGPPAEGPRPDRTPRGDQQDDGSRQHGQSRRHGQAESRDPSRAGSAAGTRTGSAAEARARSARPSGAPLAQAAPVTRRSLTHRHRTPEHPSTGSDARPGWHPIHPGSVVTGGTPHRRPPRTRFNRSVVAPPVPLVERIGRWVVIGLIVLTIILIAVATIQNRFGSLTSLLGAGAHVIEEARTCPIPWTTV